MTEKMLLTLEEKVAKSKGILQEALDRFGDRMALAWTGGKDSTTTLHLLKDLGGGRVPIPVLNIDTGAKFKEIYEFRDRLAAEWQLDLRIERNEEALKVIEHARDVAECCHLLKTAVIISSMEKYGWEALITGTRWDEQPDRARESYFSPRENPPHVRVQPILHFTEKDIWSYIKTFKVPFCALYRKGYRSLGCEPCTRRGAATGVERGGRDRDKEEIMDRLRRMGYF
ncbi:MAG: phosphoadenosine phosphosulfate reductase [Deltaproteobacteria bacterium]|nr:phosphoadenosine phosphosulfate reductase [Deltaproteobacteria bacterium]